ncbi:MAG: CAAX prenyl protease-related protein [Desulfobacteraceae bacterium]|nr:CAAX prenyl protease-related protein [Desulfobacteraceae bacterium]
MEIKLKIFLNNPSVPYILPFALFCGLTVISSCFPQTLIWLYPFKTVIVMVFLFIYWKEYELFRTSHYISALIVGLLVLILWVLSEGYLPALKTDTLHFDPFERFGHTQAYIWIAIRLFGATVVVPIMEELFWRGFLIRWIITNDFKRVSIGQFTWPSFILISVLFGLEHNRWFVGILSGVLYNLLLYRTKSLYACIIAHGLTNLGLGIYVIITQKWVFW